MKHLSLETKRVGLIFLAIVMGLLLFVPAGTVVLLASMGVSHGLFRGIYFAHTLSRQARPRASQAPFARGPTAEREATPENRHALHLNRFIALLVIPALDRRFGWSAVPLGFVVAGDVLVAIGYYVIFLRIQGKHLLFSDHRSG